jgi:site-specific DNA recombinase
MPGLWPAAVNVTMPLDARGASFVSVTQQFNTTSSMGRLTLNVLLSFAQFEREVTAERIRDKIAASKKKGLWMGGPTPLGYEVRDRKLVVNEVEAETVRTIFQLYLELSTVRALRDELKRRGIVTKRRVDRNGRATGGKPFSRGNLHEFLANPLYVGRIRHRDKIYGGLHDAIIEPEIWEAVQSQLAGNGPGRARDANAAAPSPLAGLAYDETGDKLCPTHTTKAGKRYRYYISKRLMHEADRHNGWRIRAEQLEQAVSTAVTGFLEDTRLVADALDLSEPTASVWSAIERGAAMIVQTLKGSNSETRHKLMRKLIARVELSPDALTVGINRSGLTETLGLAEKLVVNDNSGPPISVTLGIALRRRGVETKLVIAGGAPVPGAVDPNLSTVVAQAHFWMQELASGAMCSVNAIATREARDGSDITRILRLAYLAPDIVQAILDGQQPVELTAKKLLRLSTLPADWDAQRALLGCAPR